MARSSSHGLQKTETLAAGEGYGRMGFGGGRLPQGRGGAEGVETGRSAATMRRGVLVLGPMEILRGRGEASGRFEYEYRPSG